ncbi:MAG: molybdopterin molybdotransferase MoeA [Bacteroidales bacterium]|nr:molybdopterin molybdotransferase MoeA [Bacteroidales bacterium]
MIPFEQALDTVIAATSDPEHERIPLAQSPGRILATDIFSDIDMPPFNKSAVDGFACRMADISVETGHAPSLRIIETIPAGKTPIHPIGPGQCARIMTGAMVPEGADTVIMVEDTEELPDGEIRFIRDKTAHNICYKGEDIRIGDQVLSRGSLISTPAIAVLASVGAVRPVVFRQPAVAILSTGDELVEPSNSPGPAMIRNSNSSQLIAQARQMNLKAEDLGISRDSKEELAKKIEEGLNTSEVLILSGGVSMGDFDHVPAIMEQLGVTILFKSIAIQPGRPTVFGRKGAHFVFGLPGNPVSSFVIFEILVKPFLYQLQGHHFVPSILRMPMGQTIQRKKSSRKSILPVWIQNGEVFPVDYHGSAHIHSYITAHGMIAIEIGVSEIKKGELLDVRLL